MNVTENSNNNITGLPKTLSGAKVLKERYYFTGKVCKNGHIDKRETVNGTCLSCKYDLYLKRSYQKHKQARLAKTKEYYQDHRDDILEIMKTYAKTHCEQLSAYNKEWRETNRGRVNATVRRRQATKLQATPKWMDNEAVEAFYTEAARLTEQTGVPYTVDHIVPLNSERVCGLHCEANLQILLLTENSSKGNRTWPNQ